MRRAPFEEQDLRIADLVEREGRALVIGMNKWDLSESAPARAGKLRERGRSLAAAGQGRADGRGVGADRRGPRPADAGGARRACGLEQARADRRAQSLARRATSRAIRRRRCRAGASSSTTSRRPKARPPSFVLFCTRADALPDAYRRYLVNGLREAFDLPGTPIRLTLREKANPYAGRKKRQR